MWKNLGGKFFAVKYLPLIFTSNSPCKSYENEQNPHFSVFFTNVQKANIIYVIKTIFSAPILAVKNTPFMFFCFFPPFMPFFFKKLSPNSWGVKKAPCKNLYLFGENWQRNQFPKLTNLWLIFHSWYNFAIVHWTFKNEGLGSPGSPKPWTVIRPVFSERKLSEESLLSNKRSFCRLVVVISLSILIEKNCVR